MTIKNKPEDDSRRRLLIQALSVGLSTAMLPAAQAGIFGTRPARLPDGRSIFRLSGKVSINGAMANESSRIVAGDTISVDDNGELVFVVGGSAMILRGGSELKIERRSAAGADTSIIGGLQLARGKLLSVSRFTPMKVHTSTAVIAIGGTGFYVESDANLTYFCTCYGSTEVTAKADPGKSVTVESEHHDRPLYILPDAADGKLIIDAPFIDHTDLELALIEALVGRTTPFAFPDKSYAAPRRNY